MVRNNLIYKIAVACVFVRHDVCSNCKQTFPWKFPTIKTKKNNKKKKYLKCFTVPTLNKKQLSIYHG